MYKNVAVLVIFYHYYSLGTGNHTGAGFDFTNMEHEKFF